MGWAYAGETGMLAGIGWASLVNYQESRAFYRRPWLHLTGMVVGYYGMKLASAYEDKALQTIIDTYERKGYQIPEDRKALFEPQTYK